MSKFVNWRLLLIIIIAVLVVIGFVWAGSARKANGPDSDSTEPVTQSQNGEVDTSDWQTYRNEELGFELKIPPHVLVDKEFNDIRNRLVTFKGNEESFTVRIKERNIPLDQYFYLDFVPSSRITLDGREALVFEAPNGYCDGPSCTDPFIAFSIKKDNLFYNIIFSGSLELNDTEKAILSSFKLITT